jgi:flagellar biosynthetic protein FliP
VRLLLLTLALTLALPYAPRPRTLFPLPSLDIGVRQAQSPRDVAVTLQILFLMTILSLAPAILILTTSFTRIIIVLSFLRAGAGHPGNSLEPDYDRAGLFLTFFIMTPTWQRIHTRKPFGPI